ncbi:hypothetical protein SAMN05192580_1310 [Sphingomonas jatrophae]|uniref:Uncharacterized protein n=1 Tax=Sphingomonas jatrophae TaxID=1166337 RepID=A0A1I6K5A9_9SPHN|nr:hypothetical protein SAMN05192580_1310 [Sphingomonas jatrophae]
MQAGWLTVAAAGGAVALAASLAERRRMRRRETHGVGWMPWSGIVVAACFVALTALGVGLKS